jgi:hypothetical protein
MAKAVYRVAGENAELRSAPAGGMATPPTQKLMAPLPRQGACTQILMPKFAT